MPTHLDEAIKVILGSESKLRDKTPRIYQLPKEEHMPKQYLEEELLYYMQEEILINQMI